MVKPRRPHTSLILVLISAISCLAAWLLFDNTLIPLADTVVALFSFSALVWGIWKISREEASSAPYRSKLIRTTRNIIHWLWLIVAVFLNLVVWLIYFAYMPDYQKTLHGNKYYAYQRNGWEADENEVEVRMRNGLREEYVGPHIFVFSGCQDTACFSNAIDNAVQEAAWRERSRNQ